MLIARRFFEEISTGRRTELARDLTTEDYVYHDPRAPNVSGPDGMVRAEAVFENGVEGVWQIDEIAAAENDRVVVRWTCLGKHTGELMGIPPTGKAVRASALSLLPFRRARSPSTDASGAPLVCCNNLAWRLSLRRSRN